MNKISIPNPFPIIFPLILIAILLILVTPGWAQTTIGIQDFEATPASPTLTYTNTNGTTATGNGGAPATAKYVSGSQGWQANNTTSTLIFATTNTSSYSSISLTFRLAAFASTTANGLENADNVVVSVSTDGGTTYSNELTIVGSNSSYSNCRWDFSATGTATTVYDGNNTTTTVTPGNTGNAQQVTGANAPSFISITGLPASANLRVRIAMLNNAASEYWVIDDVKIEGTSSSTNTSVSFTTTSSTVSEGVGTLNLTASITNPSASAATTVEIAITGGTGSSADANSYTTQTLTFPANSSANQSQTITITDDALIEGTETLVFTLQNIAGGQGTPTIGSATYTLTITDNDYPVNPGGIAFIAFNADGNDDFAFVTLADIPANTSIWFTDNEWTGTAFNDLGEGEIEWTHSAILTAGTVVVINNTGSGTLTANIGTITGGNVNLGASDEALFALLETPATTMSSATFLAGIANDLAGSGAVLTNTGLTIGTNFLNFADDNDGYKYIASRCNQTSYAAYLPIIMNSSNWQNEASDGTLILPISTTAFELGCTAATISVSGTLTSFCTTTGTASTYQTFTVSGDNLTGNLTVTPPAGFEVSTDGGATYGTSQSVPVSGGNVTGEPLTVRVRIAAATAEGTLTAANIVVSGGGATSQNVSASGVVGYASTLAAGDISILGFNGTGTDRFAFVNWVSLPNLTKITFTDNAWTTATGPLETNENTCVWQNNTGGAIAPGTVIAFENGTGFDLGTLLSGSMSGINNGAENIFAYQGPACSPTFIFGVISGATAWVSSGITSNSDSYLPSSLSTYNIVMGSNGNGQYTASRSNQSTIAAYQTIVNNVSNWTTASTEVNPLSSTDFTIGSNPAVNLSVSSNTTSETGAPTITVTLTASAPVSGNQTVTLTVSGTNITTSDYQLNSVTQSSVTITILGGQTTGTVSFNVLDDSNVEGAETAILTISSPSSGIILGTTTVQNIAITDNDGSTFYSQASGNANTGAIWDIVPSGTGQTIVSLGGFSNLRNIVVQNGHTVTLATSGTDVLDLTVNTGGILLANTNNTNPTYFDIFGNLICNGTIGDVTNGIGFDFEGTNQTISGSGSMIITRLRKDDTQNTTTNLVINKDIDFVYGGACIYNNANFTNFHVTIGNGYVITVNGDNGSNGDVAIDGTNGASGNERGGSITVNGSLIVSNKIFALSNNNATYPCSMTIGSTGSIRTYNMDLNINNPGFTAFTINNGGALTVTNNLAVQGGTLTTNNGVILTSGGSLMHGTGTPSGGGSVSGNITMQRQGTTNPVKYNYWSSPVAGASTPGNNVYEYIAMNGTNSYADDNNPNPDPGWSAFSGAMVAGKGYASRGGGLASFTGVPNNGDIPPVAVTSSSQPLSSTTAPSKFNLIGNPYPCGLSASSLYSSNSGVIANAFYFWYDDGSDGSDYSSNDYAVRTGSGGTAASSGGPVPNGNIGAGQGFIVECVSSGNVNFTNTMRNNNNSQFFKTEEDTFMNRIWLSLSNENLYNEILIAFKEDATDERDYAYDAYKLRGNSQITFASIQAEEEYVIAAFAPVASEKIIPLLTYVATPGNYTIKNKYSEYMEAIPVYLEDRLLGTYTDISNNGTYSAYMSSENSEDRFYLHFAPLATSITDAEQAQIKTYANGNELIVLLSNFNESKGTLRIINITGKEVYSQQNTNLQNHFISVNTASFASGIYAVNLVTETNSYTVKTYVK